MSRLRGAALQVWVAPKELPLPEVAGGSRGLSGRTEPTESCVGGSLKKARALGCAGGGLLGYSKKYLVT